MDLNIELHPLAGVQRYNPRLLQRDRVNKHVIATIIARNEAETEIIAVPFGCACDHDGDLATLSFAGGMKYGSSTSKLNSRPTAFFAVNVIT
jgi:hypothetical protein